MNKTTIEQIKKLLLQFLRPQINSSKNKLLRTLRNNKKFNLLTILALIGIFAFEAFTSSNRQTGGKDEPYPKSPNYINCNLIKVVDGDTVDGNCGGRKLRIRLIGIDTPEMGQKPWGQQAKSNLENLLSNNFSLESYGKDLYGRQLGKLFYSGRELNIEMIKRGWAVAYDGKDTPQEYKVAQEDAKKDKLGIWSKPNKDLQQDPKKWRRQKNER